MEARAKRQKMSHAGCPANFRWRKRGETDCFGLFRASRRACPVDVTVAGGETSGTQYCRQGQRQHDRASFKKNILKPHLKEQWVIPPKANSAFVAAMEDVLEVYHRPHDPDYPLVCVDESSKQLIEETRTPIPMKPGQPARYDYEYERNGTANLFMMFAPLEGWRHVKVTDRHTALDYADVLKELSDTHLPDAKKIVLVWSNGSSGITPQSTAAGSTWQSPNWVFFPLNVSIGGCPTNHSSPGRSRPGRPIATRSTPGPIGDSPQRMLGSNSSISTLRFD